jgi:hypothetical protein
VTDPTSLPSFPPPGDEHPLRGRVLDALIDAGLAPNVDKDGDVALTVQGQKMFVRCVDGALPLMRVFGQWRVGDSVPGDEVRRLRAANDVTAQTNLVKATVHNDVLLVAVDLVVPQGSPLPQLLQGAFAGVLNAVRAWHVAAGGQDPAGEAEGADGSSDGDSASEAEPDEDDPRS